LQRSPPNGARTERKDDEFFVVPPGATLVVEPGNDTCVLIVLDVRRQAPVSQAVRASRASERQR
jgi:hypothetical protein